MHPVRIQPPLQLCADCWVAETTHPTGVPGDSPDCFLHLYFAIIPGYISGRRIQLCNCVADVGQVLGDPAVLRGLLPIPFFPKNTNRTSGKLFENEVILVGVCSTILRRCWDNQVDPGSRQLAAPLAVSRPPIPSIGWSK